MKKILLISASFEDVSTATTNDFNPKGIITEESSHYPLGLAYLHASLKEAGHEVKILFLNNLNYQSYFEKTIKAINSLKPDIIGFQVFTQNRTSTLKIVKYIHENYPEIKMVLGGIHATLMYEQILLEHPYLVIALGEGENTITELANEITSPSPNFSSIKGIAFSKDNRIIKTEKRELIKNLDDLPFPEHEQFFVDNNRTSGCILTSRGCPFACSFCCLDSISQRIVRYRSVENVVQEIEAMIEKIPQLNKIWIQDDSFFLNNQRVIEICDLIIKKGINKKVSFTCSARVKPVSLEMFKKLEEANFQRILFGLESGDPEVLKRTHKGITPEDVIKAVKLLAQTNLQFNFFLIVGLPGENKESIKNTAKLIQKLQKIKYFPKDDSAILIVYPGTEVYNLAKAGGMIDDEYWKTEEFVPVYTLEHNIEELKAYQRTLLNHISINNLLTPKGFVAQFNMLPHVIKCISNNKRILIPILSRTIKYYLPEKMHEKFKYLYKKLKK